MDYSSIIKSEIFPNRSSIAELALLFPAYIIVKELFLFFNLKVSLSILSESEDTAKLFNTFIWLLINHLLTVIYSYHFLVWM